MVVYLHRINDNGISPSLLKNLQTFTSLCGQRVIPDVVIATTMWAEVKLENGERREASLKTRLWEDMLASGCRVERFQHTYESAWQVVGELMMERVVV
jgi:hypothetical protein